MLKSYDELRKIDVTPYCSIRKEKQGNKTIDIPYLNWAKCVDLLHENGAENVFFTPMSGENGSSLIVSDKSFADKNGNTNSVYETKIHVVIDDLELDYQGPVMNGANPVKDNSMSQQRLWNCQCRLFVKAVAMHTGLGFDLWLDGESKEGSLAKPDEMKHSILVVREQVFEKVTALQKKGMTVEDICEAINREKDEFEIAMKQYAALARIEKALDGVKPPEAL